LIPVKSSVPAGKLCVTLHTFHFAQTSTAAATAAALLHPAGLTRLTYLSAGFNRYADLTTYLPPSLVNLCLGATPLPTDPPASFFEDGEMDSFLPPVAHDTGRPLTLNLSHLTAVTCLDFLWEDEEDEWEPLYLGYQLPPNVLDLSLAVHHGAAVGALWPLTQLTYLQLGHRNLSADHLQSLSVLTNLKVGVTHWRGCDVHGFLCYSTFFWQFGTRPAVLTTAA
jgi:hypothetical protein